MSDNRQTTIWLTGDLWAWLRAAAFARGVTQSQIVRELLEAERAKRP
jgi:hypothetical protein